MRLTLETLHMYADEEGECLLWRQSVGSHGYAQANLEGKPGSLVKNYIFTRLLGAELGAKRVIALTCGNKRCISPAHIESMTVGKVQRLAYSSGRRNAELEYLGRLKARAASSLPMASKEQVQAVRAFPDGMTYTEIARQTGLGHKSVSRIRRGLTHRTEHACSSVWSALR